MQISIDRLVAIVVKEVLAELAKRGVAVGTSPAGSAQAPAGVQGPSETIDMTGYRTPVLTEHRVRSVDRRTKELRVPAGTIITIGARDLMAQRRMKLTYTGKNNQEE
jgi:hypothetical protein